MRTTHRLIPRCRHPAAFTPRWDKPLVPRPRPSPPLWRVVAGWLLALGLLAVIVGAGVWGLMDAIAETQQQRELG